MKNLMCALGLAAVVVSCTGQKKEPVTYDAVDANSRFSAKAKEDLGQIPETFYSSYPVPDFRVDGDFVNRDLVKKTQEAIANAKRPARKIHLLEFLGNILVTMEDKMSDAIRAYEGARALALKTGDNKTADELWVKIGIVHLRMGEIANCAQNHNRESCIFPLSEKARHKDKVGSEAALAIFEEFLKKHPDNVHVRWLAEVARMTLGKSNGKAYQKTASKLPFPRFIDLSINIGLAGSERDMLGGILAEDFNGDGYLDVVGYNHMHYFENDGQGRLINKTETSGLADQINTINFSQTDYNNDGNVDIYVSRRKGRGKNVYNSLLQSNGDGTFVDVTEKVGLKTEPNVNIAAAWADYDNDGWLDLFVCNENRTADLFHNNHGKFENVVQSSGINPVQGFCGGVAWGDVNQDGFIDLFLSNFAGDNQLYINQQGKKFKRDPQDVLNRTPQFSYNSMFLDYDNDGWLDLFVANFDQNVSNMLLSMEGKPSPGDFQRLYRNKGNGVFEDVTKKVGLNKPVMAMGGNFGDLNNDGFPDIYIGTGGHGLGDLVPNTMFLNQAGKSFEDISIQGGFSNLQKGHGVAFTDLDNDGQQDVLIALGGAYHSDRYFPQFLHNPGFKNRWITLRLKGTTSNKVGIGARVKATVIENGKKRDVYQTCGKGATFGTNSLQVHLGLGRATKIENLEILWPGSTTPEIFKGAEFEKFYSATQGKGVLEALPLKKIAFSTEEKAHTHSH